MSKKLVVEDQALVFSSGRRVWAQRDVVGISPSLEVFRGYSGVLVPREPFPDDDEAQADSQRVELADYLSRQEKHSRLAVYAFTAAPERRGFSRNGMNLRH